MCKHSRNLPPRNPARTIGAVIVLACTLFVATFATATAARTRDIIIDNNRAPGATLYLAVYAAGKGRGNWQQAYYTNAQLVLPQSDTATLKLDLPDGRYAIRAYVDTNGNDQLDNTKFNRPTEPFAISVGMGRKKPSMRFHQSVFELDEKADTVELKLIYPEELKDREPSEAFE